MPNVAVTLSPPRDEQVFEDLCLDLFAALRHGAKLYGRRGHEQKGIDIYGKVGGDHVAVQCKKREKKLEKAAVRDDVASAREHDPPFARLIFATTAKRDPKLQDYARGLNEGFEVDVWFWDDLEREIGRNDDVYRLWQPILGAAPPLVDVGRLPSTILPRLIGRETELDLLEAAWADRAVRVQSVVAVGGAGKTALVHHWMQGFEDAGWKNRGAAAAYAWSFYSQGGGARYGQGRAPVRGIFGGVKTAVRSSGGFLAAQKPSDARPVDFWRCKNRRTLVRWIFGGVKTVGHSSAGFLVA